ncbi:guanosine monophosphate reductase [Candidatus Microgenomates bacterium]|nr:MAG: guanosine monophosphate reductase [Candidatus Microgenomates bacterium]
MNNQLYNLPEYLTYDDVLLLPNYSEVTPSKTDISVQLTEKISLKIPVIASPMDTVCESALAIAIGKLGGIGIIHRNLTIEQQSDEVKKVATEGLLAAAAVGTGTDFEERVAALVKAGSQILCIDSSHGHTKHVIEATRFIKEKYSEITVISGNTATYDGTKALFEAGADIVRVGMGPGSICTTRVMSGMGVPQLTAVIESVRAAQEAKKSLIADGGIRTSGDITKALAAGATVVMLGSLLAGTDEAPGEIVEKNGNKFKSYRGMGSVGAMSKGSAARYGQQGKQAKDMVAEGVEGLVPYRGPLADHINQLIGGLRAGMGYLGAKNLSELTQNAKFIKITQASLTESHPHSLLITDPGKNYF